MKINNKMEFKKADSFPPPEPRPFYLGFAANLVQRMGMKAVAVEEKRKYQRTEINEPAYVSSAGSVMSCMVRNISPEGAAIDVENPAFVPANFRLVMASDSSIHDCRIVWIQQKRIGVTFQAASQGQAAPE